MNADKRYFIVLYIELNEIKSAVCIVQNTMAEKRNKNADLGEKGDKNRGNYIKNGE